MLPPTAVKELNTQFANVKVFPNPVCDFLMVDMNDASTVITRMTLVNVNGQIVERYPVNNSQAKVDLTQKNSGAYFLLVEIEGSIFYQKIQIQH